MASEQQRLTPYEFFLKKKEFFELMKLRGKHKKKKKPVSVDQSDKQLLHFRAWLAAIILHEAGVWIETLHLLSL